METSQSNETSQMMETSQIMETWQMMETNHLGLVKKKKGEMIEQAN